jgi:hypothetical protein
MRAERRLESAREGAGSQHRSARSAEIDWSNALRVGALVLAVLAMLGLSVYLGRATIWVSKPLDLLYQPVAMVAAAAAAMAIFSRWPHIGPTAVMVATLTVPFALGTGSQSDLNVTVILLGFLVVLWLLNMLVIAKRFRLAPSPVNAPLLALCATALLSFGFGQLRWFAAAGPAPDRAQIGQVAIFVLSAGGLLLVANQVKDVRWLQWMTWAYLALAGLYAAGWINGTIGGLTSSIFQYGINGSLLWTWLAAMSWSQCVLNTRLHRAIRLALGGVTAAALYVGLVVNPGWTSGWLPTAVALIATTWLGVPRLRRLMVLAGLAGVVWFLPQIIGFVMVGDNEYSLATRADAWQIIGELARINPIFGLGPANYYWYTPLIPIRGYSVVFNSHNNYVDILAQLGVVGLACFLWFAAAAGWLGLKLRRRVPEGFPRAYVYGALGGLAGTLAAGMLGDWVLPFVYNVGMNGFRASIVAWLFLGGLVVLARQPGVQPE